MSSNSTASDSPGDGGGSVDWTEFILAIVALVVSLLAMAIATLQALQQYYASATGYSSCGRSVMGEWARFTARRMRWGQFRFEVLFDVPVVFVAPPTNTKGPLGSTEEKKIVYMDGSDESYRETYTWDQKAFDKVVRESRAGGSAAESRQGIHTADNELASWLGLLMAVQRMEKESCEWQEEAFFRYRAPEGAASVAKRTHTLAVAMQQKRRSWDGMPDSLKKPYAHTTIAHMVELAAMLGIYWREFDRSTNTYRAQGNGFLLIGSPVDDLGVGFTFQKVGPTWFQENRVVPNDVVKELCFGLAPTVFRAQGGDKSWRYADEPKDKGTLQLGSLAEIAETLAVLGCNTATVSYFRQPEGAARHIHLFPVPFELLGMVGVVIQIETTAFRMLPNPTVYHWDSASFSLRRLLQRYDIALRNAGLSDRPHVATILDAAHRIETMFLRKKAVNGNGTTTFRHDEKAAAAADKPDLPELISALHKTIRDCDRFLANPEVVDLVLHVVRVHMQEVLKVLNADESEESNPPVTELTRGREQARIDPVGQPAAAPFLAFFSPQGRVVPPPHRVPEPTQNKPPTLADLDAAATGRRHRLFAELYVKWIRPGVTHCVVEEIQSEQGHVRRGTGVSEAPAVLSPEVAPEYSTLATGGAETAIDDDHVNAALEDHVSDIWCTLVFRMICWLLLHDFHRKDVQISRSEIFGSREPVYIL